MLACELDVRAPEVVRRALLEQRLVVNATGPTTLRLLPPLTIGEDDVDEALARLGGRAGGMSAMRRQLADGFELDDDPRASTSTRSTRSSAASPTGAAGARGERVERAIARLAAGRRRSYRGDRAGRVRARDLRRRHGRLPRRRLRACRRSRPRPRGRAGAARCSTGTARRSPDVHWLLHTADAQGLYATARLRSRPGTADPPSLTRRCDTRRAG